MIPCGPVMNPIPSRSCPALAILKDHSFYTPYAYMGYIYIYIPSIYNVSPYLYPSAVSRRQRGLGFSSMSALKILEEKKNDSHVGGMK